VPKLTSKNKTPKLNKFLIVIMSRVPYQFFFFKIVLKSIILIQLLCFSQLSLYSQVAVNKKISTVVIDPGHGGKDPGTVWKNIYEKDIALSIALKLGNYIKKYLPEVNLIYTRDNDVFIPLNERTEIANKNHADLFISIHVNSNEKSTKAEGTETYTMGPAKTNEILEVAKKENAAILYEDNYSSKYDGYDPNSSVSFIIFSNLQNTHIEQSQNFASTVQNQFKESGKRINRGAKQAGYLVLWKTNMPSVLVETGFLTNEEERKFLTSEQGKDLLAVSIYKAFQNYKREIEKHSIFATSKDTITLTPAIASIIKDTVPAASDTTKPVNQPNSIDPPASIVVEFMVQISSSKNPISVNSSQFKGLKNVEELKTVDGYKYAVGRKPTYDKIQEYIKIVKNYFPDAFIIALKNGKIIPVKEALKEIKN
jgi:N-acetylmuramoyl-L-alanine amidase